MTTRPCGHCTRPVADAYLCRNCTTNLGELLLSIPGLVYDLELTRARWDTIGSTRNGGKSADTPLYIRLTGRLTPDKEMDARDTYVYPWVHNRDDDQVPSAGPHRDLAEQIVYWGLQLEHTTRDAIPLTAPGLHTTVLLNRTRRPSKDQLTQLPVTDHEAMAVWIAHNLPAVRRYPHAGALYGGIEGVVVDARKAIDQPPDLTYVGPCPRCSNELFAEVDSPSAWVRCRRCGDQFDTEKVTMAAVVKARDRLATIPKIATHLEAIGLPVSRSTLHTWKRRGRMKIRGFLHRDAFTGLESITTRQTDERDSPVFRFGDALDLAGKFGDSDG